jgi:hypothetical protein
MTSAALIKNPSRLDFMCHESLRVGGWTPELREYIRRHRLSLGDCMAHAAFLNIALVKFLSSNSGEQTFEFDVDGEPAAVIEALLFDAFREPFTADLVAWPLDDPLAFATAMGANDGADVLGPVNMVQRGGKPLLIHRTPLAWLKAGGQGCCLLKPGAWHWLRRVGGPFIAQDGEHGRELRDLLGTEAARHRILVPAEARAA